MAIAKRNYSQTKATTARIARGKDHFREWHWGNDEQKVVDWDDPDFPELLIECGRLVRLHVRTPERGQKKHPLRRRDSMIEFSASTAPECHLVFDPDHAHQRLYVLLPPSVRAVIAQRFWKENTAPQIRLGEMAELVGGKHGRRDDYPNVVVKPVGVLTAVVYFTIKIGDSPTGDYYLHRQSELTGRFPALCCDSSGRLWIAGSSYTAPTPGITD